MFSRKRSSKNTIDSLIGASTQIVGDLNFQGGLRIDGHVKGNVVANADEPSILMISEMARIEGEIHAAHLIVNGEIIGPVFVTELLELQPKARINGNVHYKALEMHHGAVVSGNLTCDLAPVHEPVLKLAANNF